MTGNLVKIEGGCATVTGYKLPQPLRICDKEGGSEARNLKSGYRFSCARPFGSVCLRSQDDQLLRKREG